MTLFVLLLTFANASEYYTFKYNTRDELKVSIPATNNTYQQAFKKASKLCYETLTGGKYVGEEKSLEIIDTCVNPRD